MANNQLAPATKSPLNLWLFWLLLNWNPYDVSRSRFCPGPLDRADCTIGTQDSIQEKPNKPEQQERQTVGKLLGPDRDFVSVR